MPANSYTVQSRNVNGEEESGDFEVEEMYDVEVTLSMTVTAYAVGRQIVDEDVEDAALQQLRDGYGSCEGIKDASK